MSKLGDFLKGFAAAADLRARAIEKKANIEVICLTANLIDGLLRIGIILKTQIENKNDSIINELLYQGLKDKIISEKEIYKKALDRGIIHSEIYSELLGLYNDRNQVVHRYILSEITSEDILVTAFEYNLILLKIKKLIYDLENEQIKLGVGMTSLSLKNSNTKEIIINMIKEKHLGLFSDKEIEENMK